MINMKIHEPLRFAKEWPDIKKAYDEKFGHGMKIYNVNVTDGTKQIN